MKCYIIPFLWKKKLEITKKYRGLTLITIAVKI